MNLLPDRAVPRPSEARSPVATSGTSVDARVADYPGIPAEAAHEPVPGALFDRDFYRAVYPGVERPREHFAAFGRAAGYAPSHGATYLSEAIRMRAVVSTTPMADIVELLPADRRSRAKSAHVWERLRVCTHPRLYSAQFSASELDELGGGFDVDSAVAHFLAHGARDGKRICALFNPQWYAEQLDALGHTVAEGDLPFFHWLTAGWRHRIVPTPLFDEDYYRARHPVAAETHAWPFEHFLRVGCYRAQVAPGPTGSFHTRVDEDREAREEHHPLLLDGMLLGAERYDLRVTSPIEEGSRRARDKATVLDSPRIRQLVEKAAAIEPLVHVPRQGWRNVVAPPFTHRLMPLAFKAEEVRRTVGSTHIDTIVVVPHCRMAGSARVAGALTKALRSTAPSDSVVVVSTDRSTFERPDWFAADAQILDLAAMSEGLENRSRIDLLLDLVRGTRARRVINVNSRLGWDLYQTYGRQLARWSTLDAYLFTWDLDSEGRKVGYPTREFLECFAHLSHVLLDNATLRHELVERYMMPPESQQRLVLARTPVEMSDVDVSGVFERRRSENQPLRALWGGRFDRQKRFDLVLQIAELMPELEIWAWGKPVLEDLEIDLDNLPSNIVLQGVYREFDELPLTEVDFMLYTSAWDGVPTLMLDGAQRGLPIVASAVGGVSEVVVEETGYPVANASEAEAYVASIKQLVAEPTDATRRSRMMRQRIGELFSTERYNHTIAAVLADGVKGE